MKYKMIIYIYPSNIKNEIKKKHIKKNNSYLIDINVLINKSNYDKIQNKITKIILNKKINADINKFIKSKKFDELVIIKSKKFETFKLPELIHSKFNLLEDVKYVLKEF